MDDFLAYICVGAWTVLTLAVIITIAWRLDDRREARRRAEMEARDKLQVHWYYRIREDQHKERE